MSLGILEVTKNQVFILLLENTFFEKPQRVGGEGGGVVKLTRQVVLGLESHRLFSKIHN